MELLVSAVVGLLIGLAIMEIGNRNERIVRWLVRRAVCRLPYEPKRIQRYEEEWIADCLAAGGHISAILRALDTRRAVAIIRATNQGHGFAANARRRSRISMADILEEDPDAIARLKTLGAESLSPHGILLTGREIECLRWCVHGKSDREISEILCVSERTVKFHFSCAMKKLGANTRIGAVVLAILRGLLKP